MAELPSGTVTFLFTDIEGSTARWEQQPEAMRPPSPATTRCSAPAIDEHGGHVVKTMGDAFHAAFARAPDAVAAALDAQRRLQAEPWGEIGPLRVRMALHTGAAEERDGDYFGPPLNRAARLLSAGHGGQVLLSQATHELVRDTLPDGATLARPGRASAQGPDPPGADLPARRRRTCRPTSRRCASLDARPHNLPLQPTPLIGREREVAGRRGACCCATTSGCDADRARRHRQDPPRAPGRRRAARRSSRTASSSWRWRRSPILTWSPRRSPRRSACATWAAARSLESAEGVPARQAAPAGARQLRAGAGGRAGRRATCSAPCPGLKVLVTSRAPLQVARRARVAGAAAGPARPGDQARRRPEPLSQYAAVALFIERAAAVKAGLRGHRTRTRRPWPRSAPGWTACRWRSSWRRRGSGCSRRRRCWPGWSDGLPLLTGGARDLPARQQTLRGRHRLELRPARPERAGAVPAAGRLRRRLHAGGGRGGLRRDGDLGIDVLDGLASLVDKSLLSQRGRPGRRAALRDAGDDPRVCAGAARGQRRGGDDPSAHAAFLLGIRSGSGNRADWAESKLHGCIELDAEHDNLRAGLGWSRTGGVGVEAGLQIAAADPVLGHAWLRPGGSWLDRGYAGSARSVSVHRCKSVGPSEREPDGNLAGRLLGSHDFRQREH